MRTHPEIRSRRVTVGSWHLMHHPFARASWAPFPRLFVWHGAGFSLWWLWFEVAYLNIAGEDCP